MKAKVWYLYHSGFAVKRVGKEGNMFVYERVLPGSSRV